MGAPSPDLCNLWLARAFNAQDVDAAAAMHHPEASIVQVDEVHGGASVARGADGIRKTMAAYVGLKPHMDVVTHHTTVAGEFAMTRSQWLIKGADKGGKPIEVHHHGMEVHAGCPTEPGCSSWTTRSAPTPIGRSRGLRTRNDVTLDVKARRMGPPGLEAWGSKAVRG
jgi:ketosteroid isomerase-like protein